MNNISSINSLIKTNNTKFNISKSFSNDLYDYYVFSSDTSFTSNSTGTVDFIMIGGGGAGGGNNAGGGGAGGVASGSINLESGTTYAVKVGAGGTGGGAVGITNVYTAATNNGENSSIIIISPSITRSLVAYFPLNSNLQEYVSSVIYTSATNITYNTIDSITGIVSTTNSGYGTSGTLDISSSFVNVNIPTFSLAFTTSGVSYSMWFYPTDISSTSQILLNLNDNNTLGAGHLLTVKSNQILYTFANYTNGQYAGSFNSPAVTISNNTWYHIVLTLSSSLTPTFYLNNVAYDVSLNGANVSGSTAGLNINTSNSFGIGCANNNTYNTAGYNPTVYYSFTGTISSVGVYNTVLTSTEVNVLYNKTPNVIAYGGGYGGGGNNGYAYNNGTDGNTGFTTLGSGGGGMAYNEPIGTSIDISGGVGGNGVNNTSFGQAGTNGGNGYYETTQGNGGGGGGAGSAGGDASSILGGNGGIGKSSSVLTWLPILNVDGYMTSLSSTWATDTSGGNYIAAGGGGGSWAQNGWQPGSGGIGGGGAGGANGDGTGLPGSSGGMYTGSGGGGGASSGNVGGNGGSGLVVIRCLSAN